jgi:NAD(P)H-dependent FMN reductase
MITIIGISGSLRKGSFNTALLRAAIELAPAGCTIEIGSIHGLPLYDGDLEEAEGVPVEVTELQDRIAAADGLLLTTPEYNNSMPGVLKNAIDWLTRPPNELGRVFHGKPVAVIGATPGGFGTVLSQTAWLPVMRTLNTKLFTGNRLMVSGANNVFNDKAQLIDDAVRERLTAYINDFVAFIDAQ